MLPTVLCLYPYNSERCRFSAPWHKLGFITLMRIFLFTWGWHANYHLFSDSVTIIFSIGFVVREEHSELGEKVVKTKSLIILVLRTWFILPFSSWTTEPGPSSPRRVPHSFSVCIQAPERQTRLPNCYPLCQHHIVLSVAKSAWHCLWFVNSLYTNQLVKLNPLPLQAAEQPGPERFRTPTWSPAL